MTPRPVPVFRGLAIACAGGAGLCWLLAWLIRYWLAVDSITQVTTGRYSSTNVPELRAVALPDRI